MNVKEGISEKTCKLCMYSYNAIINIISIEGMTGINNKQGCKCITTVNKIFKKNRKLMWRKMHVLFQILIYFEWTNSEKWKPGVGNVRGVNAVLHFFHEGN